MEKKFALNIVNNHLFNKNDNLLLAVSGGVDSVVLAHLLKQHNYHFSIAHCNFNLRGKESDADETFCHRLAKALDVPIFTTHFDVKSYTKTQKISTQMAARDLRYTWFNQLINDHHFSYLLTAHHAGDVVETVLINLLRGTGIKGLKGISQKKNHLIRPLLQFSKSEIEAYAKTNKIKFRLDKSNLETKYQRNFLRLEIIPKLKILNPSIEQTFYANSQHIEQESAIVTEYLQNKAVELIKVESNYLKIDKEKLKQEAYKESVLHFILKPFNFTETQQKDILNNVMNDAIVGKSFHTKTHLLTIERKHLVVSLRGTLKNEELVINSVEELKTIKIFNIIDTKSFSIPKKNELYIAKSKLIFPIIIRKKRTGDRFKPFGMKGFKLVSNFFKDEKLNTLEKEVCKLLVNGNNELIWIIGRRSDERYRVEKNEKDLLKFVFNED